MLDEVSTSFAECGVKQEIGLVDETDHGIGGELGGIHINLIIVIRFIWVIGDLADRHGFGVLWTPNI